MTKKKTCKSMKAVEFAALLEELGACKEAVEWADGKSLAVVWKTCKRADWMLWLCGRMAGKLNWPTRQQIVLAACDCAETVLQFVPKGEGRPRVAIETARKWAVGKATLKEVRAAADDANAAYAYATAAYAAYAACAAAYAAADAAYAAYAANAANAAAKTKSLSKMATIVRKRLKM